MNYPTSTEEIFIPPELYKSDATKRNFEDLEALGVDQDTKPNFYRGILFALIICIPFWLLLFAGIVWLL